MPELFYPELTRMAAIFTMILAAPLIDAASLCLRLAGALPAKKHHWAVDVYKRQALSPPSPGGRR